MIAKGIAAGYDSRDDDGAERSVVREPRSTWSDMADLARYLEDRTLILLSNREPYEHRSGDNGEIETRRPPGGLVSALDPTMQATRGVWVAWGSGDADAQTADESGRVSVPPEEPSYVLRRVFLDDEDIENYYLGFSNRALWPL